MATHTGMTTDEFTKTGFVHQTDADREWAVTTIRGRYEAELDGDLPVSETSGSRSRR